MQKLKLFLLPALTILFYSCKYEERNSYAVRDFREPLRPFLLEVASIGFVTYHDSSKTKSITDDELNLLARSENPILRATALSEILNRKSVDLFEVVISHLDDTALVAVDHGEFGIAFRTVSDYLIEKASWETVQERNTIIDAVLTKHNYLRSAYTILRIIEPNEKFYRSIKDMATRSPRLDQNEGYDLGFPDIEYALYGLAKFQKKEDVQILRNKLLKHVWELSDVSFRLMKEFPDTSYIDVLRTYHRGQFYKFSGNRPHGFSGYAADRAAPEDFIQALVIQKTKGSAMLLDTLLTNLAKYKCMPDRENIIDGIIEEIWRHPCPAYIPLRSKIKKRAEKILKERESFQLDPIEIPIDTTKRTYHWFS